MITGPFLQPKIETPGQKAGRPFLVAARREAVRGLLRSPLSLLLLGLFLGRLVSGLLLGCLLFGHQKSSSGSGWANRSAGDRAGTVPIQRLAMGQ